MGWVTNIQPHAICDANPGAAVLQTAIAEAYYDKVFNIVDGAADVIMWGLIIASLGTASGAAISLRGLLNVGKSAIGKKSLKKLVKRNAIKGVRFSKGMGAAGLNPISQFRNLVTSFGGLGGALLTNKFIEESISLGVNVRRRYTVINAFAALHDPETGGRVEQLPVTLSPLKYQGLPWTSGLEADDRVFGLFLADKFYSWRDALLMLEAFLEEEIEGLEGGELK